MDLYCGKPGYRAICAAAAAALTLSLAACGDKPTAETPKFESAADVVARQAQQAAAAAEKKKAEEQKRAPDPAKQAADAKAAEDSALAAKVKAAIMAIPALKSMAMDVRASGGAVTLFGTADTEAQRRQAEKVAAGVPGVTSVKDELKIVRGS
jgi:osmotically-inducible protein OsmY